MSGLQLLDLDILAAARCTSIWWWGLLKQPDWPPAHSQQQPSPGFSMCCTVVTCACMHDSVNQRPGLAVALLHGSTHTFIWCIADCAYTHSTAHVSLKSCIPQLDCIQ